MADTRDIATIDNHKEKPKTVVVGDGWAALGAVGLLAQDGREVRWIAGTGARLISPTQALEAGPGAWVWKELAARMGVATGNLETGMWLREFRNRAFREPEWREAETLDARRELIIEALSGAEARLAGALEARFDTPLAEIEEQIRLKLAPMQNVRRVEGVPVSAILTHEGVGGRVRAVRLASGEEIECDRVIYADRWTALGGVEGLPKPLAFVRGTRPVGVLQASFEHRQPIGAEIPETFMGVLQREAGEESSRHMFGWFSQDGRMSQWSVCVTADEAEDNHEIAKKLRRIKQALDKMFGSSDWLPPGAKDWQSNVQSERVRFVESVLFSEGQAPVEAIRIAPVPGVDFVTDGYGPAAAMQMVAQTLSEDVELELEGVDAWIADGLGAQSVTVSDAATSPTVSA